MRRHPCPPSPIRRRSRPTCGRVCSACRTAATRTESALTLRWSIPAEVKSFASATPAMRRTTVRPCACHAATRGFNAVVFPAPAAAITSPNRPPWPMRSIAARCAVPCSPEKSRPELFDLAAKQSLRQRRTSVDHCCPRKSDELLLLALVQSDRSRMSIGTVCRPACTTRSAFAAASVARLHHTQQLHDHTVQP